MESAMITLKKRPPKAAFQSSPPTLAESSCANTKPRALHCGPWQAAPGRPLVGMAAGQNMPFGPHYPAIYMETLTASQNFVSNLCQD